MECQADESGPRRELPNPGEIASRLGGTPIADAEAVTQQAFAIGRPPEGRAIHGVVAVLIVASLLAACGSSAGTGAKGGGGASAGSGGSAAGNGGSAAGSGGSSDSHAGSGGSAAGTSGSAAGTGGSAAGAGGSVAGAGGSTAGASGSNGGGDSGGNFACGGVTCGPRQYCVLPCCGGAAPGCFLPPGGGTCPAGSHAGCAFGIQCGNPGTCCQQDPCSPPPPYCTDTEPAGCLLQQGRTCQLLCA